jgi:DnaK suppressor protein
LKLSLCFLVRTIAGNTGQTSKQADPPGELVIGRGKDEKVPVGKRKGKRTMTKQELNKLKDTLEKKQAELLKVIMNREGIEIEKSPDALDEVQHAAERELAIRNLDRDSALLRNVRAALERVKDGSYGVCLHCEEDISMKRLNAVPWAAFCIQCQELSDRNQAAGQESFDDMLVSA